MDYRSPAWRAVARMRFLTRATCLWLLVIIIGCLPGLVRAACPATINVPQQFTTPSTTPMASGGQIQIDLSSCETGGAGFNQPTNPSHGTATVDFADVVTYTNDGRGSPTDTFTIQDANAGTIYTLNVSISSGAPTAGNSNATVAYDSTNNPINLNITGSATSVAVATQASHGTATASGTAITYTPVTGYAGPDSFTYTASNSSGPSSPATVTITVSPPTISYSPTAPPNATAGAGYSHSIAGASGGAAPYTYAVTAGALPAGLSLANNGLVSGTPTAVGTTTVQVTATDSSTGPSHYSSSPANVTFVVAAPNITISPTTLPSGTVNTSYGSVTIAAAGGTAPYTYAFQGSLPAGMTLSSGGVLSGTPTQAGTFNFTVVASDSTTGPAAPYQGSRAYTLQVAAPTITISPSAVPNATVNTAYSQTFSGSGGTAPYSFSFSGQIPSGMHFDTTGTLAGTPTQAGDFSFVITATDAQSFSNNAPYSLHVAAVAPQPPTITSVVAGSSQVTVNFTAPADNGGSAITNYTVTSNPGGIQANGNSSPIVVTGLTNGTAYTFTMTATNTAGSSGPSAASNSATPQAGQTITFNNPGTQNFGTSPTLTATSSSGLPVQFTSETTNVCTVTSGGTLTFVSSNSTQAARTCTIDANQAGNGAFSPAPQVQQSFSVQAVPPGAPTIGTATAGNAQAIVSFTAPAFNGGAAITQYTVTSNPGGLTGVGQASPIVVAGLTNGTAYTFVVTATNAGGTGSASSASNSVTPIGSQTITFNNPGAQTFGTSPQLVATSSSGLPVTFTSSSTNVCTVTSGGTLTALAPGTCTIHADQAGNGAFQPAPQVTQSFLITVPGGAVSFSTPSPLPVATGGAAYSVTINANGGAAPYSFQLTGGSLPVGMTLSPAGVLSGTPINAGTYNFSLRVTDQATQSADKNYQIVVNAPNIALAPTALPQGKVASAYTSTTLSASGGSAPYTFAVSAGALPNGLALSPAGVLSGTPTAPGSFNFTVTATDQHGFTGAQGYTVVIGQRAPIVVNSTATTNANTPVTVAIADQGGPITSITITQQPAHGTATVSGLNIVYTPASYYFGSDALAFTATGPGGTSGPATVNITVVAGAVPVATAQTATVLAGKSITIHAVTGASNGPFVSAAVVAQPSVGSVVVQGTDLVYTAPADASGTFGFDYTVSNPFGPSAPAHVTLTVNALPVAPSLASTVLAGTSVQVNLTATAHGGPFTAAKVLAVTPSTAGAAAVQSTASGYVLSFTAAPAFSGSAQVTYTLSNAYAESAPGTVTIAVAPRSDPSKNAEVLGVLDAQADAARRMATGQIDNFQRRLESLHGSNGQGGFTNGITMNSAGSQRRPDTLAGLQRSMDERNNNYLVSPDGQPAPAAPRNSTGGQPGDLAFWTGGAVNFGKMQAGASDNGIDFTTSGVSFGVDKQVAAKLTLGVGVGYGHDLSDVGQKGSRSSVDSYNVAFYGSYQPSEKTYIDAIIGYQWLQFDARRFVTDDNGMVHGSRDGKQLFGSFSAGYQHQADNMQLTPYGRIDIARASLDGYTETGDAIYALNYQRQTVKTTTATAGLLAQWSAKRDYGIWSPQLRFEFGHDFQGSSTATMRYADLLNGPLYQATLYNQSRNHSMLGAGVSLQTHGGWLLRAEYQNYLDNTSRDNQSILLGAEKKFDP